jgi:hypothetical protein
VAQGEGLESKPQYWTKRITQSLSKWCNPRWRVRNVPVCFSFSCKLDPSWIEQKSKDDSCLRPVLQQKVTVSTAPPFSLLSSFPCSLIVTKQLYQFLLSSQVQSTGKRWGTQNSYSVSLGLMGLCDHPWSMNYGYEQVSSSLIRSESHDSAVGSGDATRQTRDRVGKGGFPRKIWGSCQGGNEWWAGNKPTHLFWDASI